MEKGADSDYKLKENYIKT